MQVPLLLFLFQINETFMFSIKLCLDLFGYCCQATPSIPRCWNLGPSLFLTGGPEQHFYLHRDGWESATEHRGWS